MIDLILWGSTKTDFMDFAKSNGLFVRKGDVTDTDPESLTFGQVVVEGEWVKREGFDYIWWAGSGKLMTKKAVFDAANVVVTEANFLPGYVAIVRIHGDFFANDGLTPAEDDPDKAEQWTRSKVARYIKNNGTPGTIAGSVPYYELDGVRIFKASSVQDWLATNSLPGHTWLGGNSY